MTGACRLPRATLPTLLFCLAWPDPWVARAQTPEGAPGPATAATETPEEAARPPVDGNAPNEVEPTGEAGSSNESEASRAARPPEPGQAEFARGVELAREEAWNEAIHAFHASLEAADRPATRYNLARAYAAADQPLEAARHALAFLDLPRTPHRGAARAEVEALLAEVLRSLAILELSVTPEDAEVRVDGAPPDVTDHAGRVYLPPGTHTLQARAPGHLPFAASRLLPSGQVTTVAVALALEPTDPETIVTTVPVRWRRPLALGLAVAGSSVWAASLGTWAAARAQRADVGALDPSAEGSLDQALRYASLRDAAVPLAFVGGGLAAAGSMVSERAPARRWSWIPLTVGTALAATGLVLAIDEPNTVGAWNTAAPSRALGLVLVGTALPALGLGARWLWRGGNVELSAGPGGLRGRF